MKPKFYTLLCALWLIGFSFSDASAQPPCQCSGGSTPDSIVQVQTIDSLTDINSTITFNKLGTPPPDSGISCARFSSTVTTVLHFDLFNRENFADYYTFESYRRSRFTTPWGFTSNVTSPIKEYGPYLLQATNPDPLDSTDEVHIGPDTIFNSRTTTSNITNGSISNFMGHGTVGFDYLNTSTTTLLDGSSNYDLFVRGYSRLSVRLVYYICPLEVLANSISDFTVFRKDDKIIISWKGLNESLASAYDIEMSTDGKTFGRISSINVKEAGSMEYSIQYAPNEQASAGKIFFRIKRYERAEVTTKFGYSSIKSVQGNNSNNFAVTPYPNPAISGVRLDFDRAIKGDMEVELINTTGQRIFTKQYTLRNQPSLQVDWSVKPVPGLYYVRATDKATRQQFTTRLLIQ